MGNSTGKSSGFVDVGLLWLIADRGRDARNVGIGSRKYRDIINGDINVRILSSSVYFVVSLLKKTTHSMTLNAIRYEQLIKQAVSIN